jgi:hypothetical protein
LKNPGQGNFMLGNIDRDALVDLAQRLDSLCSTCNSLPPPLCNHSRRMALSRWGPFSRPNRITRPKACACAPLKNVTEVKPIPGVKQANIIADSCKDCIGKKFAERHKAQVGQPNVIREEDLPKVLRCINPACEIRGITHDSNRLNLILSDDDTIVQAYWE